MRKLQDERDALDLTLKLFDLSAKELAKRAGVSTSQISRYRNKARDMKASNLISLIQAMPPSARAYFLEIVAGEQLVIQPLPPSK